MLSEKSTVNAYVQEKIASVTSGSQYGQKYVPFSETSRNKSNMTGLSKEQSKEPTEKRTNEFMNSELEIRNLEIESRQKPSHFKDNTILIQS